MRSINVNRLLIYIVVLLALLALPFVIVLSLFLSIPDPYVISSSSLAPDRTTFNLDALKAHPKFGDVERLSVSGHTDQILVTSEADILRLILPGPETKPSAAVETADQDARAMKRKHGFTVAGKESSRLGGTAQILTKFSDGSVSFTETAGSAVLQVITKNPARARTTFSEIGLLVDNKDISGSQAWLARNRLLVLIPLMLAFACPWLVWMFKGGCWVAAVSPRPGTTPVSAAELTGRLLKINALDIPFRIVERGPDTVTAEWRIDGKWRGLLESQQFGIVATLDMKLSEGRRAVSVVETQRKWLKEKGVLSRSGQFSMFRGITFVSYDAGAVYGLTYVDGEFKIAGYTYKFNVQELKNPLVEVVIASGWKWEPHVFSV